jgi:tRNA(fMet)-specific endonuclease VapC
MYLLDTNTLIYFFKNQGDVAQNLAATPAHSLYISSITLFELYTGIAKSQNPEKRILQLQRLLTQITRLDFDEKSAKIAANIRADLEIKGTPIGTLDILIASIALANHLSIVTHNTKEFSRINNLQIVDWF